MSMPWVPNPKAAVWVPNCEIIRTKEEEIVSSPTTKEKDGDAFTQKEESQEEEMESALEDSEKENMEQQPEVRIAVSIKDEIKRDIVVADTQDFKRSIDEQFKQDENVQKDDDEKKNFAAKEEASRLAKELIVEAEIGVGAFGRVSKVRHIPSGRYYAMKTISKKVLRRKKIVQAEWRLERDVLVKIEPHPYVIELVSAFQTMTSFYLVMKYLPNGELFELLRRRGTFAEDVAAFYAAETALALEHLHANYIIHRDLKPENLLLDKDGHVVVTDFGLAKMFQSHDELHRTLCGTDAYMAPEMVARRSYSYAVDLWSLGILIYEMVTGKTPFLAKDTKELHRKILSEKVKFPSFLNAATIQCLRALLERQVPKRLGAAKGTRFQVGGFDALKQHIFFKRIEWQPLARRESPPPLSLTAQTPLSELQPKFNPRLVADDLLSETNLPSEHDDDSTVADFDFYRDGAFEPISPHLFSDDMQSCYTSLRSTDGSSHIAHRQEEDKEEKEIIKSMLAGLASPTSSQCDISSSCASDSFSQESITPKKPRPPRKRKKKNKDATETSASSEKQQERPTSKNTSIKQNRALSPARSSTADFPRLASIPGSPHLLPHHSAPDLSHLTSLSTGD